MDERRLLAPGVRLHPWQEAIVRAFESLRPGEQLRQVHGRRRTYTVIEKDGKYVCTLAERLAE